MSFLKNLGNKAKEAATVVGSKSQDMVEVGKLKMSISTLESDIKKLKLEIGELAYDAHAKTQEFPMDLIEKINSDIDGKLKEIDVLKENVANVQVKSAAPVVEEAPPTETPEAVVTAEPVEPEETVSIKKDDE